MFFAGAPCAFAYSLNVTWSAAAPYAPDHIILAMPEKTLEGLSIDNIEEPPPATAPSFSITNNASERYATPASAMQ